MKNENENNQPGNESGNFGLPENYFRKSARSILHKFEWLEEHKAFPKLSLLRDPAVFNVPEDYFSGSEQALELTGYPMLGSMNKENSFTVPENYFEDLENSELSKVLSHEVSELKAFPKLNSFRNSKGFDVPENYFPASREKLVNVLSEGKKAKTISLFLKRISFAAAALLIVATGIWLYNLYFMPVQVEDCRTLACLDKQDLVRTKNLESLDDEELYELVDPHALEEKLEKKQKSTMDKSDSSLNGLSVEDLLDGI